MGTNHAFSLDLIFKEIIFMYDLQLYLVHINLFFTFNTVITNRKINFMRQKIKFHII